MRIGMGVPRTVHARREARVPIEVAVHIGGHPALPGVEATFTENVSPRGARVLSSRRWKINDRLTIATLTGTFRSMARVAYCEVKPQAGFAIGLEFLEPSGNWVFAVGHGN